MTLSLDNITPFAVGVGVGLAITHVINAEATEATVRKVSRVAHTIYNSLTASNIITLFGTCVYIDIAVWLIAPNLRSIYHNVMGDGAVSICLKQLEGSISER